MERTSDPDDEMPKLSVEQENEFKRMKLELESGAVFPDLKIINIPAEIEGLFLDTIFNFHKEYKEAKQISIYERIGAPVYKQAQILSNKQILIELDKLISQLSKNGIGFETLFEYDKRIIYEFITTELFAFEVDDIRMENMMMHFVYEEFHPNYTEDIKRYCEEFWDEFLRNDPDFFASNAANDLENLNELMLFYELFDYFELIKNVPDTVVFDLKTKKATANVNLIFYGYLHGEKQPIVFEGISKVILQFKFEYWHISHVALVKN